jgi:hypothetical protein
MSLSECFDHGVPIPWANMRFNNVDIDGILTNKDPTNSYNQIVSAKGTITSPLNTLVPVFLYTLPTSPEGGCFLANFIMTAKGGPTGSTNNWIVQQALYMITLTNAGVATDQGIIGANNVHPVGFAPGIVGENITILPGNIVQFGVQNSAAGQTTAYSWSVTVYAVITLV